MIRRFRYSGRMLAVAGMTLVLASCGGNGNGISPSAGPPPSRPNARHDRSRDQTKVAAQISTSQ